MVCKCIRVVDIPGELEQPVGGPDLTQRGDKYDLGREAYLGEKLRDQGRASVQTGECSGELLGRNVRQAIGKEEKADFGHVGRKPRGGGGGKPKMLDRVFMGMHIGWMSLSRIENYVAAFRALNWQGCEEFYVSAHNALTEEEFDELTACCQALAIEAQEKRGPGRPRSTNPRRRVLHVPLTDGEHMRLKMLAEKTPGGMAGVLRGALRVCDCGRPPCYCVGTK